MENKNIHFREWGQEEVNHPRNIITTKRRKSVCSYCKKEGHTSFYCELLKNNYIALRRKRRTYICGYCKLSGHSTKTCSIKKMNDSIQEASIGLSLLSQIKK